MKLSIFTPTHNPEHLNRCYQSLRHQVNLDGIEWEWVVVLNGGATYKNDDQRVQIIQSPNGLSGVGALKRYAVTHCTGDVFIELDHDDELTCDALNLIAAAARGKSNAFIYSATIEIDTSGNDRLFGKNFGWIHHADENSGGRTYNVPFDITARSLAEVFFTPNHVRAWTRAAYHLSGGHNAALPICDDQEIVMKTYLAGAEFIQLHKPVYIQYLQQKSTQFELNKSIQETQADLRDQFLPKLAIEWSNRNSLKCLDLGGAHGCPNGFTPVDKVKGTKIEWDIERDLLGFAPDNSVGCIRASDFLEHIPIGRVVPLMNDIYRALAPGGWLLSFTPSTDGRGAFQDPTHLSYWNQNSFWYYTRQQQAKYVPEIKAKFQAATLKTIYPSDWHKTHCIPYVVANLSALKGQRQPGLTEI